MMDFRSLRSGKVPVVTHSSVTNLLIFHKYLDQNAHYRASMRLPPLTNMDAAPAVRGDPATDFAFTAQADDEDLDDDDDDAVSQVDPGWSLSFGPLTEEELMVGHLVKERLIKLLDYPSLRNHLLKRKNLLQLLVSNQISLRLGLDGRDGKALTYSAIVGPSRGTLIHFSTPV